jgi:hypothetical protein
VAALDETDLRPRTSFETSSDAPQVSTSSAGRPPWYWLCLAAVTLLTGEWFLYQRRWIT